MSAFVFQRLLARSYEPLSAVWPRRHSTFATWVAMGPADATAYEAESESHRVARQDRSPSPVAPSPPDPPDDRRLSGQPDVAAATESASLPLVEAGHPSPPAEPAKAARTVSIKSPQEPTEIRRPAPTAPGPETAATSAPGNVSETEPRRISGVEPRDSSDGAAPGPRSHPTEPPSVPTRPGGADSLPPHRTSADNTSEQPSTTAPVPSAESGRVDPRLRSEPGTRAVTNREAQSNEHDAAPGRPSEARSANRLEVEPVRPRRAGPAPPAQDDDNTPTIHVSIGRVDVRAVEESPKPRSRSQRPAATLSLDDYLARYGRPR